MRKPIARPLTGLLTVAVIALIFAVAIQLFRGALFDDTVPVTVVSDRAGLVMYTDAKVKMRDIEVGRVASIEDRSDGSAVIHLAMNPAKLRLIPENVRVDVAATTVFGDVHPDVLRDQPQLGWVHR